jgi:hypothetical protein
MNLGPLPRKAATAVVHYLRRHPEEFLRAAKNAAALKVGVPIAALRFLADELGGQSVPEDLVLEVRSPGLFVQATIELMHTPLLASGTLIVDRIEAGPDSLLVDVRIAGLELEVTDPSVATPVAALLRSGSLDVSRPGDLLTYMPKKPSFILGTKGDKLTLDLLALPALARDPARKIVLGVAALLSIEAIQTEDEHLDIALRALPRGAATAIAELRRLF